MRIVRLLVLCCTLLLVPGAMRAQTSPPEIAIGAILSETGPSAFLGGPAIRSLKMLVEEINAGGGINGQRIRLVSKDTGGNTEKAVSFAKQLINEEKVLAIIGPSTSGESLAIKRFCEAKKTILLSCSAAELIVTPVTPHVFKVAPSDSFAVKKIFAHMQNKGIKQIAVLSANDGFGKAGKEQLLRYAPEFGIGIVSDEVYDKSATDLTATVAQLKARGDVQAVVNWSIVPAQSILVKNIRQASWNIPIYQSHGFANIKYAQAAGTAAEGIIFPASRILIADFLPDGEEKNFLLKYRNSYESRFKENISTFGGHTYDAMTILAKAIEKGGADPKKVRDAVEETRGLIGTAGTFNFSKEDHGGLSIEAFAMITVKDGRFVPLEE